MQEVFKIAEFDRQGKLKLRVWPFESYANAVKAIEALPNGTYQVQKVFIKQDAVANDTEPKPQPITFVKSKLCPKDQEYLIDQLEAYFDRWPRARNITDRDSFTAVITFRFSSFVQTSHVHILYYPGQSSHIRMLAMVNNKLKPIGYFEGI